MAQQKSALYQYNDWPSGGWHSIPYATWLEQNRTAAGNPPTLPPPPRGTYDSALDYNADAANKGLLYTQNDAQTQAEQGKQNYDLDLGNLTQGRDRTLTDLLTQKADVQHQYSILGHQQAQSAAQHGITSAGLLGKSASIRGANEAHDIAPIDLASTRANQDFTQGKTLLDLNNARQFGGFNGQSILNPLTGQPEFGKLFTDVTRAGASNNAYQTGILGQMAQSAADRGYVSPLLSPTGGGVSIGNTPLTGQQYNSGLLLESMLRGSAKQQGKSYEEVARGAGIDPVTLKRIA